jgi:uncharacterized protein
MVAISAQTGFLEDLSCLPVAIAFDTIATFCDRWQVSELAIFGSILRPEFHANSDVDFLVEFIPTSNWGLLDHAKMQIELEEMLHRKVDLISRRAIEHSSNWIRRQEILSTARVIYALSASPIRGIVR